MNSMKIFDDPIEFIKTNPQMFLRGQNVGLELSTNIIGNALLLTGKSVTILKQKDWWIIACEKDWLENDSNYTIGEIFSRMIPFPQAGQNSIRAEILLTAFAQDIITVIDRKLTVIKGDLTEDNSISAFASKNNSYKRILAFRM
jgi:hypothetical protein